MKTFNVTLTKEDGVLIGRTLMDAVLETKPTPELLQLQKDELPLILEKIRLAFETQL